MVGDLAEAGMVIHDDFRSGNVAQASANLDFLRACKERLPRGHCLAAIRAYSASYQAWMRPPWQPLPPFPHRPGQYADRAVAETVHSMAQTDQAFRRIVVLYPHQADLETEHPRYHVIANNPRQYGRHPALDTARGESLPRTIIKELKPGFGMERMPCDQKSANAAFFRLGVLPTISSCSSKPAP